ncbi:MAG: glycosyltransferase family 4 protein [Alphaproteobacteria bacterium]|nr:glycosyltransferase family 4 protein [Alphaproteobacteria bacterium]
MSQKNNLVQPVIVQVLPSLNNGGVERGTIEISHAIHKAGWKSIVISSGGILEAQLKRTGAIHYTLPVHNKNPISWAVTRSKLKKILKEENADLVHVRSRMPAWIGLPVAKMLNIPTIATIHGKFEAQNIFKRFYNRKMLTADKIIAISEYTKSVIERQFPKLSEKISLNIVHRGVDTSLFNASNVTQQRIVNEADRIGLPDDLPVVMLPARPAKWKGHVILLEALSLLKHMEIACVLMGAGDSKNGYSEFLEKKSIELGLGAHVRISTSTRDMPAALMLADVVAMPSVMPEPFGRTSIEAQAMGRPVVAFDHGGARETIAVGKTGWLAEPNNVESLAMAIEKALNLSQLERDKLSTYAQSYVKRKFSVKKMTNSTLDIYKSLLLKKGFSPLVLGK